MAWNPLGWKAQFFSEIEKFPSAVLDYRHPGIPNLGDMTKFKEWNDYETDVIVGGTPCQSFSVAGLRKGLDDPRGNLMLTYLAIADRYRPRWVVWENVPGVLSSNGGRDFGTFLGALGKLGYGWAFRVLNAQYFGVPQRRRRVFVVGYLGDWRRAAGVLFERHSLQGHSSPSKGSGKDIAGTLTRCSFSGGAGGKVDGAAQNHFLSVRNVANTLKGKGNDDHREDSGNYAIRSSGTLTATYGEQSGQDMMCMEEGLQVSESQVRRLTPVECERLQGFPDNYTRIPWKNKPAELCPLGPRYKALGNSFAVPVISWIGKRINIIDKIV